MLCKENPGACALQILPLPLHVGLFPLHRRSSEYSMCWTPRQGFFLKYVHVHEIAFKFKGTLWPLSVCFQSCLTEIRAVSFTLRLSLWAADLYLLLKICSTSSLKWLFWLLHIYIHRIPADQVVLFNRFCCTQVIISTVHCWVYWWQKMWKMLITFSQSSEWRLQTASCCPNNGPNRQNSSFMS